MSRFFGYIWIVLFMTPAAVSQDSSTSAAQTPSHFSLTVSSAKLNNEQIHQGDEFDWEIRVRWYGGKSSINPEMERQPDLQGVAITKSATTLRTGADSEGVYSEKVFQYTLTAAKEGNATIGTAAVSYQLTEEESPTVLQTAPEQFTIHAERFSFSKFWLSWWNQLWFRFTLIIGLAVILGVTCLLWFRKPIDRQDDTNEDQTDPVEGMLTQAKSRRIEGDFKGYFIGLEEAVRLQLNTLYPDVSSTDLRGFMDQIPPEKQTAFQRFLQESEEAKYAPVAPSAEALDRAWDDVKRIVSN